MNNREEFLSLCREKIHRPGIDELLKWLDGTDFFVSPASTRFHGSYPGGLAEHSLNVYREIQRLLAAYPEIEVTDESAAVMSLFHDVCKADMYVPEKRNRKNSEGQWESYDTYTIHEKYSFGGHGSKSVYLITNFMKLTPIEAAAINCHMGAFGENKDSVGMTFEKYPEAWLLSVADQSATYIIESVRETQKNPVSKGE